MQKFHQAFFKNDKKSMKKYLNILSNFKVIDIIHLSYFNFLHIYFLNIKDYQQCVNEFIKNSQMV
jgi:hypothetical protein